MPHLRGAQLHCHAGVVNAANFILSDLERHRVLHQVLLGEQPPAPQATDAPRGAAGDQRLEYDQARGHEGWTLVLCGHSLGAGVATVLSLHLRNTFPDVRVWGIEPPAVCSARSSPRRAASGRSVPSTATTSSRGSAGRVC